MKDILKVCPAIAVLAILFSSTFFTLQVWAQEKVVTQIAKAEQPAMSPADKLTVKRFENRVKQYVKLRESVKTRVPKLNKDSTPEQIQAAETNFVAALQKARAGAKPGDLFRPDIGNYVRAMLKREFKGAEKQEIRKVVLDKESTIPVPLKINYPYPDPKEFVEMPATLLLKLPQIPKQLKYRYVGHTLMLIDTDNNLIIDYLLNALP